MYHIYVDFHLLFYLLPNIKYLHEIFIFVFPGILCPKQKFLLFVWAEVIYLLFFFIALLIKWFSAILTNRKKNISFPLHYIFSISLAFYFLFATVAIFTGFQYCYIAERGININCGGENLTKICYIKRLIQK